MTLHTGVVEGFDADVGLGSVVTDDGATYRFHCTTITDGSRLIDARTRVSFVVGPAGPGQWEARALTPLA